MGLRKGTAHIFTVSADRCAARSFPRFLQRTDPAKRLSDRLAHRGRKGDGLDRPGGSPGYGFPVRLLCPGTLPALFPPRRPEVRRAGPAQAPDHGGRTEAARETGQKKLYREQREAIREAVRLELLGQTLPVPSFFEICWSVPENTLIFCSLSDKVFEELQELFRDSFQLTLCPYVPWDSQSARQDPAGSG